MTDARIREFTEADYPAYTEIRNAVYPDYPESEAHLRRNDDLRDPKYLWRRWVWEEPGRVLAVGYYVQDSWNYHPRKFNMELMVKPDARRRGIATALKIRAISSAKAAGYRDTLTWNAEENAGMLGINTRLGFRASATWVEVELAVGANAREASGV